MSYTGNVQNSIAMDEHQGNLKAKRTVILDDSGYNSNGGYATIVDDTTTANTIYIGKAPVGSATSAAVWQIARLDTSSGLIKTWADSDASFDNVWDDRASLTYS